MKKFFKKSISCIIAVLMVISAMPFTALTANAALAYQVTGQYDFTSTISDSTFSNAVEGYSGSSFILKGNAWDREHGLASNGSNNIFDLKTVYSTYPCVTKATSGQAMTFRYDGGDITVAAGTVDLTGLYMYDGFMYIDNLGSYLSSEGFRISWTEQYFSKSSDSGAGVFSLGTGNNGDVLKWTTNDNKLYADGSAVLDSTPVDGTVYDITLTSGTDKKINVLVKNHSTNATVIDYTTSGTFDPTSLNYLVIGSVNQGLDKLGRFTLSNLTIEKGHQSLADYVKTNIGNVKKSYSYSTSNNADSSVMNGLIRTGTWTDNSDTLIKYNSSNSDNQHKIKIVGVSNAVGLYTGESSDIRFPLVTQYTFVDDQYNVKNYIGFDHIALNVSNTKFAMGTNTWSSCSSWDNLTAVTNSDYTTHDFSTDINQNVSRPTGSRDNVAAQRFKSNSINKRHWKASLKYTGNFSDGKYYDSLIRPTFHYQADYGWTWGLSKGNHGNASDYTLELSTPLNFYVLNIKPLLEIINSSEFESHFNTIYNNLWMYDSTGLEAYFTAMKNIINFNLDNESLNDADQVKAVADKIKKLVDDYKDTKDVSLKTITVTFNMGNGDKITKYITAGKTIGDAGIPANTSITKINGQNKHNVFSWQAGISDIVPHYDEDATFNEIATPEDCSGGEATCEAAAVCDYCHVAYGNALGHDWGAWTHNEGTTTHTRVCSNDPSHPETVDCNFKVLTSTTATCMVPASVTYVCEDCGYQYTDTKSVDPNNHTGLTEIPAVAATCTKTGLTKGEMCTACGVTTVTQQVTDKKPHTEVIDKAVAPTCTNTGLTEGKHCSVCDTVLVAQQVVDALNHNFTLYEELNADNHTVKCSRDCGEEGSTYTEPHDMDGNTCKKCGYIAKVTITFKAKDGSVIRSDDYDIGADITIPNLPDAEYTANGDGATHTEKTYAWDNEPQTTAQTEATYTVVQTTDNAAACHFGDTATRTDVIESKTYDIFTCTLCHGEKQVPVADKTALNEAILQLQNDLDLPEAGYKYDAELVEKARDLIDEANALGRYADQSDVDAMASRLETAKNKLNAAENLAKYTITVQVVNSDDDEDTEVEKYGTVLYNQPYGTTFEHSFEFDKINDGTSMTGLPKYAVYKWMVGDVKLNTADTSISDVVKGNATYICYVLNFKASTDVGGVPTTTRVRYLDKSGHTIDFDRATIGQPYKRKDTSKAPVIPYYTCTGWEPVFGDESNVGTRELVYKPIYTYKDSLANKCEIVGLNGVRVNGEASYQAIYDERIELSGADMFAYADKNGNIIARINANYIYAPHINGVDKTIYITKVETATEKAETIITGTFTIDNPNNTNIKYLVVNGQYYLPENANVVECGIVIGNVNDAEALKIGSAVKVKSDSQGENHEYSVQMSYSKGKTGTLYSRSYLIYVDANGATQTVYSDAVTECIID